MTTRHFTAGTGAVAACGVLAAAIAVAVTLEGSPEGNRALVAIARGLMVGLPIAVGLWASGKPPADRIGRLLVVAGFGWTLTTFAESDDELLYTIGRTAGWIVEAGLLYLVLAFPSTRLLTRMDRNLARAIVLLLATLYLPLVFISDSFPVPSPYTSCTSGCPGNAFFLLHNEPGIVDSLLRPLREGLTVLLFAAVAGRLVQRSLNARVLMRRILLPVTAVAILRVMTLALGVGIRLADPGSDLPEALSWVIALAVPAAAVAFGVGLIQWRLYCAESLERLGASIAPGLAIGELGSRLRTSLGDPSVRLLGRENGGPRWLTEEGEEASTPRPLPGEHLTHVRDGDEELGLILHDAALDEDPEFRNAVVSVVRIAMKTEDLTERLESSLTEVRHSRARIVATADRERRRIERNLHDGAQQRLVALRVQLELTEELFEIDPENAARKLHSLGPEIDATLDEIRSLAHGVYPPLLTDAGLAQALAAAARRLPIPASVDADGAVSRYPGDVEGAVYFCCLEAMQNASKHAEGAGHVTVALGTGDGLTFEVRDDGGGFDPSVSGPGAGLNNMRDRIASVGGEISVESTPGEGTVVAGRVPVVSGEWRPG